MDMDFLPPPPPIFSFKVSVELMVPFKVTTNRHPIESLNACSTKAFTIVLPQQYTNNFSCENFIGEGMLGSVYWGELPNGKVRFF